MKKAIKVFVLCNVIFWYFFGGHLLTVLLCPLETKGFYITFGGKIYSIIDLNIPHFIAFVFMGITFNFYALIFAVIAEPLQQLIRGHTFSFIDIVLNLLGSAMGIFIVKLSRDIIQSKRQNYRKETDQQDKEDGY